MNEGRLNRRRLLRGAVPLAVLAAAGTGCATGRVEGTPKFGLSKLPSAPTPSPSPTPEPVQLSIAAVNLGSTDAHRKALQTAANGWASEAQDTTVRAEWTAPDTFPARLAASAAAGSAPDVLQYWPDFTLIKQGLIEPMDELLKPLRYDYLPAALQTVTFKDHMYGVPIAEEASFFCHRKSVLAKAHLPAPRSLDELAAAAKKLTSGARKGIGLGINTAEVAIAGPLLWAAGQDFLTDDHRPGFTGGRVEKAVGAIVQMVAAHSVELAGAPEDISAFLHGDVAIQWIRGSQLPQVSAALGDDLGIMPFPRMDAGGKPSVPIWTTSLLVGAKGKHQDVAIDLVRRLSGTDSAYLWDYNLSTDLSIPPRRSVAASGRRLRKGAAHEMLQLATQYGRADARPDWTPPMYHAYSGALRSIFLNHAKASAALGEAAAAVRSELKKVYA